MSLDPADVCQNIWIDQRVSLNWKKQPIDALTESCYLKSIFAMSLFVGFKTDEKLDI